MGSISIFPDSHWELRSSQVFGFAGGSCDSSIRQLKSGIQNRTPLSGVILHGKTLLCRFPDKGYAPKSGCAGTIDY